jgi:hypothetical protein
MLQKNLQPKFGLLGEVKVFAKSTVAAAVAVMSDAKKCVIVPISLRPKMTLLCFNALQHIGDISRNITI